MRRTSYGAALAGVAAFFAIAAATAIPTASVARPLVAGRSSHAILAGHARFEVLSPTLIRLEYSPNGRFENRPTILARDREPTPAYTSSTHDGVLTIRTRSLVLHYRKSGGRFGPSDLTIRPRHGHWHAKPSFTKSAPGNLGGWVRGLDDEQGPVALHQGLLTRAGWYLLDDSSDALRIQGSPGFAARSTPRGYQDGYFFGYGRHYATALRDLRRLTGPAPLLPRTAFGVWFSRYFAYAAAQYPRLLGQFRRHHVPVDTLSIDTDWKRQPNPATSIIASQVIGKTAAYSWNGWEWNTKLFPHPAAFLAWAHRHHLQVALNIHPSIDSTDPKYGATVAKTGPLPVDPTCTTEQIDPAGTCHVFDLTKPRQLSAYFALHAPIKDDGVDEWWLDWCCDASVASAPGLTPDTWFNLQYTERLAADGDRWLVLSRIGGSHGGGDGAAGPGDGIFAEHRYAIHFTGDTCATWRMLGFEAKLTADEGNVGLPYVSHDIGSFLGTPGGSGCTALGEPGAKDPPSLYARWVQFGALQPILRLHSNHGHRLPWEYPQPARRAAADALRLREALVPYLYTVARQAYDTGMPITRPLYLQWPKQRSAYRHPSEYTVGRDVLFSPVTHAGNPAPDTVWFPPGRWIDYFTGHAYAGPSVHTLHVRLGQMAMFLRAGSILPTEQATTHTAKAAPQRLDLSVFGRGHGSIRLYDDAGTGFAYRHHAYTWTRISDSGHRRGTTVRIGRALGHFPGEPRARTWRVSIRKAPRPLAVTANGRAVPWRYRRRTDTVTVTVHAPTNRRLVISLVTSP